MGYWICKGQRSESKFERFGPCLIVSGTMYLLQKQQHISNLSDYFTKFRWSNRLQLNPRNIAKISFTVQVNVFFFFKPSVQPSGVKHEEQISPACSFPLFVCLFGFYLCCYWQPSEYPIFRSSPITRHLRYATEFHSSFHASFKYGHALDKHEVIENDDTLNGLTTFSHVLSSDYPAALQTEQARVLECPFPLPVIQISSAIMSP